MVVLVTATQSCDNYLKEELVTDVAASAYYSNFAGIEDAVDATYAFMKMIYSNERAYSLTTFGTDAHTNGADGGYKSFNYYDNGLNSGIDILKQMWDNLYMGINQANAVLDRGPLVTDIAEFTNGVPNATTLTTRYAEVRFLRALYYFTLAQQWGNVPLVLKEQTEPTVESVPIPESQVYDAIVADLEFAMATLPATQPQYGRATKPAAEFLLGRVLATRGYRSFAKPDDFSRSEALFTTVITSYTFALQPGLDRVFNQDNQRNSEIIFAVQFSGDAILNGSEGNRGHLYFLMEYDIQPGMARDINNGRPFKRFRPTNYLVDLYAAHRQNDARYDQTYKHVWISNNAGNIPSWTAAEVAAGGKNANGTPAVAGQKKYIVGDTAIFIPGPGNDAKWTAAEKLKTRYRVYTKSEYTERIFPTLAKHIDPKRPTIQWEPGSRDFFLMRLADAYLMRAEVRFKQGNTAGAAADINVLRTRSAKPGRVAQNQVTAAQITIDFILDERLMELDGEMLRWYDLVRTRTLAVRAKAYNQQAVGVQDYHMRRPVPQTQIDRTQPAGSYPQNCGYPGGVCTGG